MCNVLQNIKIPHQNLSDVPSELYFRSSPEKATFKQQDGKIYLEKNSSNASLEFNTFFGAFSLTTWCGQAGLSDVGVSLEMEGTGIVSIWHKEEGCEPIKIYESLFNGDKEHFSTHLENLQGKKGIIYPKIETDCPHFVFHHGNYWSLNPVRRNAHLTIVMTTFKREEYVRRNLALLSEEILSKYNDSIDLLIIDNGQTLASEKLPEGVRIIPSKNFGGSGGFSRGVLETLNDERSTHLLFCDDDILIEPESIFRLKSLLGYIDEQTVIGGGMIFISTMSKLCEIGAFHKDLHFFLCRQGMELTHADSLVKYDIPEEMNYFGWWFFCTHKKTFEKEGLPLPLFVRSDDIEFGHRLIEKGYKMLTLLGLAVWHEDFDRKVAPILDYYAIRNGLITMWIHDKEVSGLKILKLIYARVIYRLETYRYQRAEYILLAFEHALKGPEFLVNLNPTTHHQKLIKQQTEIMEKIDCSPIIQEKFKTKPPSSLWVRRIRKVFSILTLNGHLLPSIFMIKGEKVTDPGFLVQPLNKTRKENLYLNPTILYYEPNIEQGVICRIDRKKFFLLLLSFLKLGIKVLLVNSRMIKKWQVGRKKLTTVEFWQKYLFN